MIHFLAVACIASGLAGLILYAAARVLCPELWQHGRNHRDVTAVQRASVSSGFVEPLPPEHWWQPVGGES